MIIFTTNQAEKVLSNFLNDEVKIDPQNKPQLVRYGVHRIVINLGELRQVGKTTILVSIFNRCVQNGVYCIFSSTNLQQLKNIMSKQAVIKNRNLTTHQDIMQDAYFRGIAVTGKFVICMDDTTTDEINIVMEQLRKNPHFVYTDVDFYVSMR